MFSWVRIVAIVSFATANDSVILSSTPLGLIYRVSEPGRSARYMVVDTGSQYSSIKGSLSYKAPIEELFKKLRDMAPRRSDLIRLLHNDTLDTHHKGIIGLGGLSAVGQKSFAFLPIGKHRIRYIDRPRRILLRRECKKGYFNIMDICEKSLSEKGEWSFPMTASFGDYAQDVHMAVRTGGKGIELPQDLFEIFVESLEDKGMLFTPAEGIYEGFLFLENYYRFQDSDFPQIYFESEPFVWQPKSRHYTIPFENGLVVAIKSSGSNTEATFGALLANEVAMLFDYSSKRLYLCHVGS